jgi:hypothetical protein
MNKYQQGGELTIDNYDSKYNYKKDARGNWFTQKKGGTGWISLAGNTVAINRLNDFSGRGGNWKTLSAPTKDTPQEHLPKPKTNPIVPRSLTTSTNNVVAAPVVNPNPVTPMLNTPYRGQGFMGGHMRRKDGGRLLPKGYKSWHIK